MPDTLRLRRRFLFALISLSFVLLLPRHIFANSSPGLTLCQISDTVYRADGVPAQGDVEILWSAFTTAAGQPVTAGSLTVTLGANGQFNAALAPNSGATPAGSYYRVTYKLNDGSTASEYWSVPAAPTTTIGAIRSKLVPANQAAQYLTRDFADSHYLNLSDNQTVGGVKIFTRSPTVPAPVNPMDAASKAYVDSSSGATNLASPPPIGNIAPNTVSATLATAQDLRTVNFPVMDLRNYGLKGDGLLQAGCNITVGQKAVTCTASGFTALDVGKAAFFPAAGAAGAFLNSTIASYQSATQVTLADAATTAVTNGPLWYGTDNTAAWCAAMNCTSATPPNTLFSAQPGRTVLLPRGTYFISGTAYTRNNDNLMGAGQAATQVLLFNATNSLNALCMGSNASAGANTCTLDSGTQNIDVEGILWGTPENGSQVCINPLTYSGFEIKNNWFECGIGVLIAGNIGSVIGNTFDSSTFNGVVVKGDGEDYGNNPSHSILISDNQFFANKWSAIQVDGASGVQIHHNNILYAKQFSVYVASPEAFTTYRLNISDNNFAASTGFWNPTENHIYVSTPLVRSVISGNTFGIARDSDILLNNSGIVGLTINSNKFYGGQLSCGGTCTASLQVTSAGAGLNVTNNQWDSPGNYAGDFQTSAYLRGNYCTQPFAIAGTPTNDYDKACFRFANAGAANLIARDNVTESSNVAAVAIRGGAIPAYSGGNRSGWATGDVYVFSATGPIASSNERIYNGTGNYSVFTTMSDTATGNASFAGDLSARDIPGHEYFVSKYASMQAAINAAYNNGTVLGTVIDDRIAPYAGPGFIVYDSVVLRLAPTTYTINGTVTYNNGNNNVTAGIIALPGAHIIGASPSSNHGTILSPANGLNADLIATSTVGTGTTTPQWWHWGEIGNLRLIGNGTNQTTGDCLKVENMGEVASIHDIEFSACYGNNFESIGYAATQSAISDITSNRAVTGSGVVFTNLSGVAVLNGVSGDCNQAALIAANFNAAGTVTIHGLKAEAESSICTPQVQDPVILASTTDSSVLASVKVDGGYAFGTTQHDFIKSSGPGAIQYEQENFYLNGYVNILNDTVRGQVLANAATAAKQPVFYLSNGVVYGNQAFTLQPNTFVQGNPSDTPTEIFGMTSSAATLLGDAATATIAASSREASKSPDTTARRLGSRRR